MEKSWRNNSLIVLAIIIGLVILAFAGLKMFVDYKALSRLTPEQKKQYEEFVTKKLTFDPDEIKAEPFTSETMQLVSHLRTIYDADSQFFSEMQNRYNKVKKQTADGSATSAWDDLTSDLPRLEPLLAAYEELIKRPDYELSAFRLDENDLSMMGVHGLSGAHVQNSFRFMEMKTRILIRDGMLEDALELAPLLIRASRTRHYDTLISRLIGISFRNLGTIIWHEAMRKCNDAALLRRTLERQKELADWEGAVREGENIMISDYIGLIRDIQKKGFAADIQGKTGQEIMSESLRVQTEYLEKIVLPTKSSDQARKNLNDQINALKITNGALGGTPRSFKEFLGKAASPFVSPVLYSVGMPNTGEAYTRSRIAQARYDLLMLETARRIRELEGGGDAEAGLKFNDVFASNGRTYGLEQSYYSIGPDGKDQRASIAYDPTNGTISRGDVYLIATMPDE